MSDVVRITACRLCDSPDLELVVSFTPTPIGDHYVTADKWNEPQPCYPLDVLTCKACGAVQLADTVDPKLIYPDTYLYTTSVSKGLDKHFDAYANDVLARTGKATPFVVDIGCNDGTLLKAFKLRGCEVLGVEPSLAIGNQCRASGIDTYHSMFHEALAVDILGDDVLGYGAADIITANHVMANVADLHDFTKGVKHLLAPDGTFVFETGYWPAIVEQNLIDTIEHEHIHYFAVGPLAEFFYKHGLHLVHVEKQPTKGGSLRGYVRHIGVQTPDASVEAMSNDEAAIDDANELQSWVANLTQLEQRMRELIAQSEGEIWVGYGAAVGSTLLLHQFGLGEKLLCLVDSNPQKQGRLSPGYHLRVVDPSELQAINPDKIVILAWRYAELIMAQHPEFAGKWILPLPEVVTA
jgi:SAM-dependent methyltransferase